MGQAMIHGKRLIGGHKMLCHRRSHHGWQGLPAILLRHINPGPATSFELLEGVFGPGRCMHRAGVPGAAFTIANGIQGRDDGAGQLARFV